MTPAAIPPAQRIITALDVETKAQALALVRQLNQAGLFKVGLELFTAEGPALLQEIQALGKGVFLDLKLHDIPNTVGEAARIGVRHGARMMTIHASGGKAMMARAAETAGRGSRQTRNGSADSSRSYDPDEPPERRPGLDRDDARHRRPGPPAGRPGQSFGSIRRRLLGQGNRNRPEGSRSRFSDRHPWDPAGLGGCSGPEAGHDAGPGRGEGIGLPRHREADHPSGLPARTRSPRSFESSKPGFDSEA